MGASNGLFTGHGACPGGTGVVAGRIVLGLFGSLTLLFTALEGDAGVGVTRDLFSRVRNVHGYNSISRCYILKCR